MPARSRLRLGQLQPLLPLLVAAMLGCGDGATGTADSAAGQDLSPGAR